MKWALGRNADAWTVGSLHLEGLQACRLDWTERGDPIARITGRQRKILNAGRRPSVGCSLNTMCLRHSLMRRGTLISFGLILMLVFGCGTGTDDAASGPEIATTTVDTQGAYADAIRAAFTEAHPKVNDDYDRKRSSWAAFAAVVEDMEPPPGSEVRHARMLAEFEQFIAAMDEASATCDGSPQAAAGSCFAAVADADSRRQAAIKSIYEATGMTYDDLFRDLK